MWVKLFCDLLVMPCSGPLTSLTPHLDSPLATPASTVKRLAHEELARAKDLNANEGYLLKNMEKDCEYTSVFE